VLPDPDTSCARDMSMGAEHRCCLPPYGGGAIYADCRSVAQPG
jgi:hypothetical protein